MDEGTTASETVPDLKDIEVKIGRKTPEGLLKWMREEAAAHRGGDAKLAAAQEPMERDNTGKRSLDEKIRKLKVEMAHLRSVDVKILQQLLAVHEGIEAVKWVLEERSTLTSRCSSLTSSQYSLGEGPDTSWRGSWSSLQDPNDKLDNISIGSYLDTLADDMDEYCPSSSESIICSPTLVNSEVTTGGGRTGGGSGSGIGAKVGGAGAGAGSGAGVGSGPGGGGGAGTGAKAGTTGAGGGTGAGVGSGAGSGIGVKSGGVKSGTTGAGSAGTGVGNVGTGNSGVVVGNSSRASPGKSAVPSSSQAKSEGPKEEAPIWTKAPEAGKGSPGPKDGTKPQAIKTNGVLDRSARQTGGPDSTRASLKGKLVKNQSPKVKPTKNGKMDLEGCKMNGKMDLEGCKMNGKMHLEYDAHWRWVQSQDDVTFL